MAKVSKKPGTYLYPLPPSLITWVGTLCSEPPIIGISIRPSRYSHKLVKESGEFAVNVPTAEMVRAVDWCGTVSGHSEDKFQAMGLTPIPTQIIHTATIKECPLCIERGEIDLGKANPLAYGGHAYWTLGQFVEKQGYTAAH
ncbi:MAG: hypothetical protein H6Q86_5813 [candidate division NC10 bacterium]|nr:hypothetical protein [candidate division NC10 bacterium]